MKNLLVLTDLTENADHAAFSAVALGRKMHTNILLFHTEIVQPVAPEYVGPPTLMDTIEDEENLEKLQNLTETLTRHAQSGSDWKPEVHFQQGVGSLAYQVDDIEKENNIEMIVMGCREGGRIDHFLTGSETFSVVDHSSRPVLLIPHESRLINIRKVLFATNYTDGDVAIVRYLIKLGHMFNFTLEIVHINLLDENDITRNLRELEFMRHMHQMPTAGIIYKEAYGKNITRRLNRLCQESKADILAFSHYRDSFFSRLFRRSITRKAISAQTLPLLIFPANFKQ
ncbi:MAG: universal stress protein [Bacteroidetes bacterium]|nr:universal stress protein [Bacteroidota bacterium]